MGEKKIRKYGTRNRNKQIQPGAKQTVHAREHTLRFEIKTLGKELDQTIIYISTICLFLMTNRYCSTGHNVSR